MISDYTISRISRFKKKFNCVPLMHHRYRVNYAIELKRKDCGGATSSISSRSCFFLFASLSLSLSLSFSLLLAHSEWHRSVSDRNVQFYSIDASSLRKHIERAPRKEKLEEDKPCRNLYIFNQIGDTC